MRKLQANKKRLIPLILCSVLVLQQSLTSQALAGNVTDINGNQIPIHPGTGAYELRPEAINKNAQIGFRQFKNLNLNEGEVMNFIFQALQQDVVNGVQQHKFYDVNTFVNFVQTQGNIKGIVNAIQGGVGGSLKTDGNLVFISPEGMVVGASGVLNVGSLQVFTPSVTEFDRMRSGLPTNPTTANFSDGSRHALAQDVTNTYNSADSALRTGSGAIQIDGKIYARNDIELSGGKVGVGNSGLVIAGLGNNTEVLKSDTIFDSLVNADNLNPGNGFASSNGKIVITSNVGTTVENGGAIKNYSISDTHTSTRITNTGNEGINIAGEVSNPAGELKIANYDGGLNVTETGVVKSNGKLTDFYNEGSGGMNIQGKVTHHNTTGTVQFTNKDSNMVIGHQDTDFNITSDADVNIDVTNGNVYNYGVANTLIKTTDAADLNINVQNGSIGKNIGPCDGGICTGVGPGERDLTLSVNTEIDGDITAYSKGTGALINMASLDKDMHVNQIHSDGRVILLADDKRNKGATAYDIMNTADDNSAVPNLKGKGISAIASGNIGKTKNDKITFIQTDATVDIANEHDDANGPHDLYDTPRVTADSGVEFLAIKDVNIKGLDNEDGTKNDTSVCTIASRTGTVNAEFSGNTYIRDITAQNEVNVVTRGTEMYIENLGGAPSRYAETGDYYGGYDGIVPEKANIKVLDLGTVDNPNLTPNSTLVIKNGTVNGQGSTSHPDLDQDITVTADNAYVGGYYFNMGKHRMPGLSSVTKDDRTNPIVNANPDTDKPASIRGKAVRPDDVTEIGEDPIEREYYYGKDPANPDDPSGSGQKDDPTFDPDKEPADDLVVPEPDPGPGPGDDDDDDDGPIVPGPEPQPTPNDKDITKETWKKEYNDYISVIDKRQYIRFDIRNNQNPVVFESTPEVDGILNISRGGVQLAHNNSLKVGDVVPVHVKYGDVEIDANVKIVTASDIQAGGEFVDLDLATANKLLYLSLLKDGSGRGDEENFANTNYIRNENLSTTGVDD